MGYMVLRGKLMDAAGNPMGKAFIKITSTENSDSVLNTMEAIVQTDASGYYNVPLAFGEYTISIRLSDDSAYRVIAKKVNVVSESILSLEALLAVQNDLVDYTPFLTKINRVIQENLYSGVYGLTDILSVKDFGAIGDGKLHTLQEWVTNKKFGSLTQIQAVYPKAQSLEDSIDWLAIQTACDVADKTGAGVLVPAARYVLNRTLYHNTYLYSLSALPSWRAAPFSNIPSTDYEYQYGAEFLFVGSGPKEHHIDYVTESRQCGYDRVNPVRSYNNSYDAEFLMTDFTNRDAVGATAATRRLFSVAVVMGSGESKRPIMSMSRIRVITSCPGDDEEYGIKGYADQSGFHDWAHWDVGVWCKSPWRATLQHCQIVGYWDIRGHLMTVFGGGSTAGYSEFYDIDHCIIQGGYAARSGDIWPILSKTDNTLTIEWTASHQFTKTGSIYVTEQGNVTYSDLVYNAQNKTLTFVGCADTSKVIIEDAGSRSVIRMTSNAGMANSRMTMCEVNDFSHSSHVEEQATNFPYKLPIRSCIEVSGHPTRGIAFYDTSCFGTGPVLFHFGNARDIEFYSCYYEPKSYKKDFVGGSFSPGAAFIMGPKKSYFGRIPKYDRGYVQSVGKTFTSYISMEPWVSVSSLSRLAGATDMFNPIGADIGQRQYYSAEAVATIASLKGQDLELRAVSAEGYARNFLRGGGDATTYLGCGFKSSKTVFQDTNLEQSADTAIVFDRKCVSSGQTYMFREGVYTSGNYRFSSLNADYSVELNLLSVLRNDNSVDMLLEANNVTVSSNTGELNLRSGADQSVRLRSSSTTVLLAGKAETVSTATSCLRFNSDNVASFGLPSNRVSVLYAGSAPIITSDARLKKFLPITEAERAAAAEMRGLICKFQSTEAIAEKGESLARLHFGVSAQSVRDVFTKYGLDPERYGVNCHDSWEAEEEVVDEDGNILSPAKEAGDRYGVRYEQLILFMLLN